MPDLLAHQQQAEHNRAALAHLSRPGDDYLDWVATVLFYTALHIIDQVLAHRARLHPASHRERRLAIQRDSALRPVFFDFAELEHQSRRARYECVPFNSAEIAALQSRLDQIEQHIAQLLPSSPTIL